MSYKIIDPVSAALTQNLRRFFVTILKQELRPEVMRCSVMMRVQSLHTKTMTNPTQQRLTNKKRKISNLLKINWSGDPRPLRLQAQPKGQTQLHKRCNGRSGQGRNQAGLEVGEAEGASSTLTLTA